MPDTDEELVHKAQAGDIPARDQLIFRHMGAVKFWAHKYRLYDEDTYQVLILESVFFCLEHHKEPAKWFPYLQGVCTNKLREIVHAHYRNREYLSEDGEDIEIAEHATNAEDYVIAQEIAGYARDSARKTGFMEMAIVDERWLSNTPKKLRDIGKDFGVCMNAVNRHEIKFLNKLRKELGGKGTRKVVEGRGKPHKKNPPQEDPEEG